MTDEGHVKVLELGLMSAWGNLRAARRCRQFVADASADQRLPPEAAVDGFHCIGRPNIWRSASIRSDIFDWRCSTRYDRKQGSSRDTPSRIAAAIVRYAAAS